MMRATASEAVGSTHHSAGSATSTAPAASTASAPRPSPAICSAPVRMLRSRRSHRTAAPMTLSTRATAATATTTPPRTAWGCSSLMTLPTTMAAVTAAMMATLARAARIGPRWYPNDRARLRGRSAHRTASSDTASPATSVTLCPASDTRPVECATRPPASCAAAAARLSTKTSTNRLVRLVAWSVVSRTPRRRRCCASILPVPPGQTPGGQWAPGTSRPQPKGPNQDCSAWPLR